MRGFRGLLFVGVLSTICCALVACQKKSEVGDSKSPVESAQSAKAQEREFDGWEQELKRAKQSPPKLELQDIHGKTHRLSDYAGKTVIVNFWATWCPPCVEEMPGLEALRAKTSTDKLVILTISNEKKLTDIARFMTKESIKLIVLRDVNSEASSDWAVTSIPTSFIISPDQKIRYKASGGVDFESPDIGEMIKISGGTM